MPATDSPNATSGTAATTVPISRPATAISAVSAISIRTSCDRRAPIRRSRASSGRRPTVISTSVLITESTVNPPITPTPTTSSPCRSGAGTGRTSAAAVARSRNPVYGASAARTASASDVTSSATRM